ncbi:MAG: class II fumarate hydratase [Alphaproteobacteria bacterium]
MKTRVEKDTMGEINVPEDCYWGAQTQRSLENFKIGQEKMPLALIHAFALQKKAAAIVNLKAERLTDVVGGAIIRAAEDILDGNLDDQFPLVIWQTGSGTQTHMNVNEVIANRANEIIGEKKKGTQSPVHPNDHVNQGQSSNDSFPTAMNIAAIKELNDTLLPALKDLYRALLKKSVEFRSVVKMGRTHMQDATPMTVGQEFSAFAKQLELGIERVMDIMHHLYILPQGGTAVGTGLNTFPNFDRVFASTVAHLTGFPFLTNDNKFEGLASNDAFVQASGTLNTLAASLMKITNDIRLLGSGPRGGLGELILPSNEPGSSIMPGKVNPTQCEALSMIAAQVMGNHTTITVAGASGHLQLNVFKPVIIYNFLQSLQLISEGCRSFTKNCVLDIQVNEERLAGLVDNSLMLATALNPAIGYEKAAQIAKKADAENTTLKEATLALGFLSEAEFDRLIDPKKMLEPQEK